MNAPSVTTWEEMEKNGLLWKFHNTDISSITYPSCNADAGGLLEDTGLFFCKVAYSRYDVSSKTFKTKFMEYS
jgi:hypothetical protein